MVQAVAEVPEAEAQGKIKSIYDDVKATLRVPYVPPVFLALATEPDYLSAAWTALKANAQTIFFERQADALRRAASQGVSGIGSPPASGPAGDTVRTLDYATPKVFLATAALRSATNGEVPRMQELPADEKRQVAPGVPDGAAQITLADTEPSDERVRSVFADITSSSGASTVSQEYRALAAWPDYLESAWNAMKPAESRPEVIRLTRSLRLMAEQGVTALPFRMDISPHVLRQCGLSESQIDRVKETLNRHYRADLASTVTVAFLAGQDGSAESPFPATVL